ncbi:hypothetical protein GCM10025762_48470 [Haloechinothrix salitolerans]
MRHDDGYDWPTDFEVYGHHLRSAEPYPVPIRCGLLTLTGDPDDCVIAIGVNEDEPVTITAAAAARLREILANVASEHTALTRRTEHKRLHAAQQLIGDAAVVLATERWQAILAALSSDDRTERDQVLHDLQARAPGTSGATSESNAASTARTPDERTP